MSNLDFTFEGKSATGLTNRWAIRSRRDGELLGTISWYSPWRRYTAQFLGSSIFDAACLKEVTEFIEKEMIDRRSSVGL